MDDLEAKAGKIEEMRKEACPEITHAINCVVATRPLTSPVVQDIDTVQEAKAKSESSAKRRKASARAHVGLGHAGCLLHSAWWWAGSRVNGERKFFQLISPPGDRRPKVLP